MKPFPNLFFALACLLPAACGGGSRSSSGNALSPQTVDPGTFADNTDLTSAFPGVTLIADIPATPPGDYVTNSTAPLEPTQFTVAFSVGGLDSVWTDDPGFVRIFEADFDALTDFVSVDIRDGGQMTPTASTGVLEAYDTNDVLLDTAMVTLQSHTTYQTLSLPRAHADIAYVRVYGTGGAGYGANVSLLVFDAP
jgi:hypothetical protein